MLCRFIDRVPKNKQAGKQTKNQGGLPELGPESAQGNDWVPSFMSQPLNFLNGDDFRMKHKSCPKNDFDLSEKEGKSGCHAVIGDVISPHVCASEQLESG